MKQHLKYIVASLLNLVAPHCSACIRPATQYEGTTFSTEKATDKKRYACDLHAVEGIKWSDLPGAEMIRAALSFCDSQDTIDPNERGCPCLHTTPCHPRCTCVNGAYSTGCRRCARYGSKEQQIAIAEHLACLDLDHQEFEQLIERLPKCNAGKENCTAVATRQYTNLAKGYWCEHHHLRTTDPESGLEEIPYAMPYANLIRRFQERKNDKAKTLARTPDVHHSFPISNKQNEQAGDWIKSHNAEKHIASGKTRRNSGAIGGAYTYEFTPTTIHLGITLRCSCGEKIDLTDPDF